MSGPGAAEVARVALHKVFPDHWSFLLGEIALFCYIVLFATGLYLTFFFTADTRPVTYAGPVRARSVAPRCRPPSTRSCGCRSTSAPDC